ncbi:amidase domain-containing protein [Salinithrix halophila]|uniref:Amidase domain-containing protein n=1 Tax=Salinithrix halophila TaxID=1485204 RepID=A0ABV8JF63_9BACL
MNKNGKDNKFKKIMGNKKVLWITGASLAVVFTCSSLAFAGAFGGDHDTDKVWNGSSGKKTAQAAKEDESTEKYDTVSDKELADNISYYNESPKSEQQIKREHQAAVKIVQQKSNQNAKPDLNDPRYRDKVRSAATNLEGLTDAQKKQVQGYVKDVGEYENKEKNKRLRELKEKAKKGQLTQEEKAELYNLQPIKNPGPKIKATPVKNKPKKETSEKEQATDSEKPDGQQEENQELPRKSEEQPEEDQELPRNPEDEQGDKGTEEEPQQPDEQPNEQQGDNADQEQPQAPDNEGGNEEERPQQPGDQPGEDQEEPQQPGSQQPQPQPQTQPGKEANGYDRAKVREYAYKWWNKRNNEQYGFYSRERGGCYDCWYDCTNFVSQAMKAGNFKEKKGRYDWYDYWYYNDTRPAMTWSVANSFFKHMKLVRKAQQASDPSQLKVGDILNVDFEKDGYIDHSVIVTKIEWGIIYATYHTSDNKDKPINDWFMLYDVYGWKMGTAKN